MAKYKKLPGIEYMPDYSLVDSAECDFAINWYICNHCHETFIYDYGKIQRHDPNFCPVCGAPNEPTYKLEFTQEEKEMLLNAESIFGVKEKNNE